MKLLSVDTTYTPHCMQVGQFETRSGQSISVYFGSTSPISAPARTDHFFLVGALAAFLKSEAYQHHGLVDAKLYENFHAAMRQWEDWWGHRPINISAQTVASEAASESGKAACLMSGGVDSMFTLEQSRSEISTLINLIHARQPGEDVAALRLYDDLSKFAAKTGDTLIGVETNVMYAFREIEDAWTSVSHGLCMAAVGHFLGAEIDRLIISASFAEDQLRPWGSHPKTDPLMSSASMEYRHDGEAFTRFEKHRAIASNTTILKYLSVCERGPQAGEHINCSNCQKCLRSMITLDLLGVDRSQASSFDWSAYDPTKLSRFLLPGHVNCSELLDYAEQIGRTDIATVLQDTIAYAEKYHWIVQAELFLRRRFKWILKYKTSLKRLRAAIYGLMKIRTRRL